MLHLILGTWYGEKFVLKLILRVTQWTYIRQHVLYLYLCTLCAISVHILVMLVSISNLNSPVSPLYDKKLPFKYYKEKDWILGFSNVSMSNWDEISEDDTKNCYKLIYSKTFCIFLNRNSYAIMKITFIKYSRKFLPLPFFWNISSFCSFQDLIVFWIELGCS